MKNSTKAGVGVLAVVLLWHLVVAVMPGVRVSSLFQSKPAQAGFGWTDSGDADARFFWQLAGVSWQPGLSHPTCMAETTAKTGVWQPLPGYKFIDSLTLTTAWEAALLHPDYMAWSDDVEGKWIPVTGYRFVYEGDTFVDAVWDPGKRYDDLKVISLPEKDRYKPFPGYKFLEPGRSLRVIWTPGTINPDNPKLVAGAREGSWNVNRSSYWQPADQEVPWLVRRMVERAIF